MIGDTPNSDIEGARRAGIPGVLISKDGSSASEQDVSPADAAIEDLNGLFDPGVVLRERYEEARP
jgi:FMN phosphatase YigB (HAD superfamily)